MKILDPSTYSEARYKWMSISGINIAILLKDMNAVMKLHEQFLNGTAPYIRADVITFKRKTSTDIVYKAGGCITLIDFSNEWNFIGHGFDVVLYSWEIGKDNIKYVRERRGFRSNTQKEDSIHTYPHNISSLNSTRDFSATITDMVLNWDLFSQVDVAESEEELSNDLDEFLDSFTICDRSI